LFLNFLNNQQGATAIEYGLLAAGRAVAIIATVAAPGVPVDGISSPTLYAEQYTAWHLTNTPVIAGKTTLTAIDMIKF
jgi:Flp pilus assembly pilin Flp